MQAVATWGEGSVSRGLKWGLRGPIVHFPRAAPLGPSAPSEPFQEP